ncbi:MAG: signal peptidase II [Rhizobiales bacterium]|nr:signal peptidase II [Hyphomicrobiales bacterium]
MKGLRLWSPRAPLVATLAILVFAIDQSYKWWMLNAFAIAERQPVPVTSFFDLVLVWNTGVSYGLFRTHSQAPLILVSLAVSLALWLWACRAKEMLATAALAIIIGGALSNALDRAHYGAVADFFLFHLGSLSWYVFNFADVAIVAGVLLRCRPTCNCVRPARRPPIPNRPMWRRR